MNKKLIASAVSVAVMAPLAAQAQQDTTFSFMKMKSGVATEIDLYGRVNTALAINTNGDDPRETNLSGVASRLGVKADSDLGNGLVASARYEFKTDTAGAGGITGGRIATVGLSGGFGSITVGQQWSAFFDTVGTLISPTYSVGYVLYSGIAGGPYRSSNAIKYSNSAGPVYFELDLRVNQSAGDGAALGVSFNVTDNLIIAAAYDRQKGANNTGPDTNRSGLAARLSFGNMWASLGTQSSKTTGSASRTHNQFYIGGSFDNTSILVGYGQADAPYGVNDAKVDYDGAVLGVYQNLGGGMTVYYEGYNGYGIVGGKPKDTTRIKKAINYIGVRYDF